MPHQDDFIAGMLREFNYAEQKHPAYPQDVIHASAILNEEVGKLVKACNDYVDITITPLDDPSAMDKYALRVGAMALRLYVNNLYQTQCQPPVPKIVKLAEQGQVCPEFMAGMLGELQYAENKHSGFPRDVVSAAAIVAEEAGKLTQACIDYHYGHTPRIDTLGRMEDYTLRVGAMALRLYTNAPAMPS